MDLTKIKEAAARENVRNGPNEYPAAYSMKRDDDRALLLAAAPGLLAEIERLEKESEWRRETLVRMTERAVAFEAQIDRLRGLAREGWERARDEADDRGNEESRDYAAKMLGAIEATS